MNDRGSGSWSPSWNLDAAFLRLNMASWSFRFRAKAIPDLEKHRVKTEARWRARQESKIKISEEDNSIDPQMHWLVLKKYSIFRIVTSHQHAGLRKAAVSSASLQNPFSADLVSFKGPLAVGNLRGTELFSNLHRISFDQLNTRLPFLVGHVMSQGLQQSLLEPNP